MSLDSVRPARMTLLLRECRWCAMMSPRPPAPPVMSAVVKDRVGGVASEDLIVFD